MVLVEAALKGNFALVLSASEVQVNELYRAFKRMYLEHQEHLPAGEVLVTQAEFANGGRVLTRPASERSSRGFHGAKLLVLDEAARIPDDLFAGVVPSVSMAGGRIVALSTPYGKRGWFWEQWDKVVNQHQRSRWQPAFVPWWKTNRVTRSIVEDYRILTGDLGVSQEYECTFHDVIAGNPFDPSAWERMMDGNDAEQ